MAIAKGDYRQRDVQSAKDEESRRYALAYNTTILQEQPFITPGNALEESLVALARNPSETSAHAFEEALLTSKVYLVTTKDGRAAVQAGSTNITFWRAPIGADADAMVLFTSEARVREALHNQAEVYWLAMTGRDALRLGRGLPVAVNLGLQPPLFMQPAQAEELLARSEKRP